MAEGEQNRFASNPPTSHDENEPSELSASQIMETGEPLAEVLAQLTEGVATLTASGNVVSWNPPAAHLTGYTISEINHTGFWRLFEPPDTLMNLIQQARNGVPIDDRIVLVRADGQRIPVGVRCFPLRHLGDTTGRFVVVLRDLSELEALHNQLLQSERLSMLGRLAGAVSHEIRNPLTAIFLQTDILEDELHQPDGGDRKQITRSLRVIKEEVARLHDLVQQYLSLARLANLQRDPVDFGTYLETFCEEMRDQLEVRGISLRLQCHRSLGHVALHANSFRRVLLNLVTNAVEAMPKGGILTLRGKSKGDTVHLEIRDTGCGIPPEQIALLFSPLHTTKPEGTGLGLYLAREILAAHDSDIAVTSEPDVGTTFLLTLPRPS
ncbi:MAG: ATP-binding protein [Candidatus Tectomicrobia bacterium]|nr:ATP-binding protein [Candidatus Tectomicrobia bacterium]